MTQEPDATYSLELFARISGVAEETILRYCERGFIRPLREDVNRYDDEALRTLRRIEHLRETCGVNDAGLRLILDLLEEIECLRR
ncbi:MAG TPA: MerR family transcriptional regulator [Luteolibacter sp.]|nr:MerR family transcriptional regulator [Luteolibacter sp.]